LNQRSRSRGSLIAILAAGVFCILNQPGIVVAIPIVIPSENPSEAVSCLDLFWHLGSDPAEFPLRVLPVSSGDRDSAMMENLPCVADAFSRPLNPTGTEYDISTPLNPSAFSLAVRPQEFTFSELLLNPAHDPQSLLPRLGLHLAVAVRDLRLLERLLQMGEDPNSLQTLPLWMIPLFAEDKTTSDYLAKDAQITPLMLATLTRQPDFVRLLLQYGADKERLHTRRYHLYPLDFAARQGDVPMMQLLLGRDALSEADERRIVVSLSGQRASFLLGGRTLLETPVSTGKPGYRTPPGEYVLTQKYRLWRSNLYHVPMPNFMRLNCSSIGLHGGEVPDVPASHGCIRLPSESSAIWFELLKVGDRVSVVQ